MTRKTVYVAGPITFSNPFENMRVAIAAGQQLIDAGFAPFVPHLTVYWDKLHNPNENTWDTWLEIDLPWVSKANAVLRLPGKSPGADREVVHARERNIPVFYTIDDIVQWFDYFEKQGFTLLKIAKEPEISIPAKSENQAYCDCPSGNFPGPTDEIPYTELPRSIYNVLLMIVNTFTKKNADYAADKDGWRSNFDDIARQCGVTAAGAANTLIAVKQARLRALESNGRAPTNEAIEDTLLDRAVYAMLALALYQEDNK